MASTVVAKQRSVERLIASCEGLISGKGQFQGKDWKLSRVSIACHTSSTENMAIVYIPDSACHFLLAVRDSSASADH